MFFTKKIKETKQKYMWIRHTFKQEGLNCHNFIIHISEDCRESKLQNEYVDLLTNWHII